MGQQTKIEKPSSIRILLVDDSDPIQRMMHYQLIKEGFSVSVAADGRHGVAKVLRSIRAGHRFDIIFMDLDMPRMDGYDAFQRIRKIGYQGPVVALTACTLPQDKAKCQEAGFNDFVEKPVNKPLLLSIIARLIQKDQAGAGQADPS